MALIDNEELDQSNYSELDAEDNKQKETPVEETPAKSVEIPEKYKGKSLEDIVQMHQEAEKLIGRQAQEVGEVRRLADDLIKQQLSGNKQKAQPNTQETQEIDFFEDPQTAVQKAVSSHPDVLAAKQAAAQFKAMQTQQQLATKHPDYSQVVQDGEFIDWVKASPVRLNMFAIANSNYDFAAADELLSTFKQIRTAKTTQTQEAGKQALKQNLKAAAVDTGGTGESSKKVYRRADLIRLRMNDPDRYMNMQPEIMAAYAEGRVK